MMLGKRDLGNVFVAVYATPGSSINFFCEISKLLFLCTQGLSAENVPNIASYICE